MLLTPAQIKPLSFESRRNSFSTRGGCASCLCACLVARLLPQSYQYQNLSEAADRVGGQLRGDKEYPFSGVTKSDRVWRKVPESDARSVAGSVSISMNSKHEFAFIRCVVYTHYLKWRRYLAKSGRSVFCENEKLKIFGPT